jgi:hypothetical protein
MKDILSGATPLIVDVRQTGASPTQAQAFVYTDVVVAGCSRSVSTSNCIGRMSDRTVNRTQVKR